MNTTYLLTIGMGNLHPYVKHVIFVLALGLSSFSPAIAQIDVTIDVYRLAGSDEVVVSPNPFYDYAQIQYGDSVELLYLTILTTSGETIETVDLSNHSSFSVFLSPAIYVFLIQTSVGIETKRVVMQVAS